MFSKFPRFCQLPPRGLWQRLMGVMSPSPFSFRKEPLLPSRGSNTALNLRPRFPASFAYSCGHVIKFWAIKRKRKCPMGFLLQGHGLIWESFPFRLFSVVPSCSSECDIRVLELDWSSWTVTHPSGREARLRVANLQTFST